MSTLTKRNFLALGLGAAVLAGTGYAMTTGTGDAGYDHTFMPADEMQAANALIVDIRTPQEWRETGVIEGARLVTFNDPGSFLDQVGAELADGRDLILVCRSGNRTQAAARALAGRIDHQIVSIAGGMKNVIAAGYQPVPPV